MIFDLLNYNSLNTVRITDMNAYSGQIFILE